MRKNTWKNMNQAEIVKMCAFYDFIFFRFLTRYYAFYFYVHLTGKCINIPCCMIDSIFHVLLCSYNTRKLMRLVVACVFQAQQPSPIDH